MEKTIVEVPSNVEHISDWIGYTLPRAKVIVDKQLTGCGYTEFCLRNGQNVVLCSPRKLLLKNKSDQHIKNLNIKYIKNEIQNFDGAKSFEEEVRDHIAACTWNKVPCKLLVTYDSSFRVVNVLKEMGILDQFFFVIDEFQSIFLDSYFKSEIELDFVEAIQDCPNVLYLSATPMLDKYLEKLDYFKDLPFYKLDWSKTNIVDRLVLKRKFAMSLAGECSKIVQEYLKGKFKVILTADNRIVHSDEAVFYFNSVKDIIKVIKKNGLKPDQVNIICADTKENIKKLKDLSDDLLGKSSGPRFVIGEVPLEEDRDNNKMFTFCTKSAYIGSDFHSRCARSFVFSDPNITSLALDIALDLPQIAGRQRDKDNPFKDDITIFYRTIRKAEMVDRKKFDELQESRREESKNLLDIYRDSKNDSQRKTILNKIKAGIILSKYSDDFISISKYTGEPVYNTLIELANERAWEVCQKEYQDVISITKTLEELTTDISDYLDENEKIVQDFLDNQFYKTGEFDKKMKFYCEFMDQYKGNKEIAEILCYKIEDSRFRIYYNFYGTIGCRRVSYAETRLRDGVVANNDIDKIEKAIYSRFKVGESYTKKEIKEALVLMYRDLGVTTIKPKAVDLGGYFKLSNVLISDSTGKRSAGFRLGSLI